MDKLKIFVMSNGYIIAGIVVNENWFNIKLYDPVIVNRYLQQGAIEPTYAIIGTACFAQQPLQNGEALYFELDIKKKNVIYTIETVEKGFKEYYNTYISEWFKHHKSATKVKSLDEMRTDILQRMDKENFGQC